MVEVNFDIIFGLEFGIEFVPSSPDENIPNACVIVDFACFRWIFELIAK